MEPALSFGRQLHVDMEREITAAAQDGNENGNPLRRAGICLREAEVALKFRLIGERVENSDEFGIAAYVETGADPIQAEG